MKASMTIILVRIVIGQFASSTRLESEIEQRFIYHVRRWQLATFYDIVWRDTQKNIFRYDVCKRWTACLNLYFVKVFVCFFVSAKGYKTLPSCWVFSYIFYICFFVIALAFYSLLQNHSCSFNFPFGFQNVFIFFTERNAQHVSIHASNCINVLIIVLSLPFRLIWDLMLWPELHYLFLNLHDLLKSVLN